MGLVVKTFNISTIDIKLKGLRVRATGKIVETWEKIPSFLLTQ